MDKIDIFGVIIISTIVITLIINFVIVINSLNYESNYICTTIDNEIINCKKIYHHEGYIEGITQDYEVYIIKSYKEVKENGSNNK